MQGVFASIILGILVVSGITTVVLGLYLFGVIGN
jgi:hypothetical protein